MPRALLPAVALAASAVVLPETAAADGWSISDLGSVTSLQECVDRAEKVVLAVPPGQRGEIFVTTWNVFAYNLAPGDNDVVISCPTVAGQVNAFVYVYGDDGSTEEQRQAMREYVKARF